MATVKTTPFSSLNRSISASISSSVVPRASRRWIASARSPTASDAVSVSTTRIRSPPTSPAAVTADWYVPESFADSCSA